VAEQTFKVRQYPAYGVAIGSQVTLDPDDPLVQINIGAGVLVAVGEVRRQAMTCPACKDVGTPKRPPRFTTVEDLTTHYNEKHPALVIPDWEEEE